MRITDLLKQSAIELNEQEVIEAFKPRVDMIAVKDSCSKEELLNLFIESGFSRIPVYHDNIDNVIGIINEKDLINIVVNNNNEESNIIKSYLANMSDEYKNNNSKERIVIDYIAGMTDDYTLKEYNKILKSKHTSIEV